MSYVATIKRVSDGVCIDVPMEYEWCKDDGHTDQFWWEEGNFVCDCNRAMQYGDEDETCGDSRYRVKITLPDGSVPYDEIGGSAVKPKLLPPPRSATWCFEHSCPLPCRETDCRSYGYAKEGDWGVY